MLQPCPCDPTQQRESGAATERTGRASAKAATRRHQEVSQLFGRACSRSQAAVATDLVRAGLCVRHQLSVLLVRLPCLRHAKRIDRAIHELNAARRAARRAASNRDVGLEVQVIGPGDWAMGGGLVIKYNALSSDAQDPLVTSRNLGGTAFLRHLRSLSKKPRGTPGPWHPPILDDHSITQP